MVDGASGNTGPHVAVHVDKGSQNDCDYVLTLDQPWRVILVLETPQIMECALLSIVQVWFNLCSVKK